MALEDPLDNAIYTTTAAQWAEDANYAAIGDAKDGHPTKVTPSLGVIRQGARPQRQLPGPFLNFILNAFAQFLLRLYLDLVTTREETVERFTEVDTRNTADENARIDMMLVNYHRTALTVPIPGASVWNMAKWNRPDRYWVLVGDDEEVRTSSDGGRTWATSSAVAAVGSNEDCHTVDIDTTGNIVVSTNTRYVFVYDRATTTWSRVDVAGGGVGTTPAHVAYDRVNTRWCWMTSNGVSGQPLVVFTSTTRTAWAAGTPPTGWTTNYTQRQMFANTTSGVLVAAALSAAGVPRIATSSNGGQTWTNRADVASAIASPTRLLLVYDHSITSTRWFLVICNASNACEVWRSTDDGANWTLRATLTNAFFTGVAPTDAGLVGLVSGSDYGLQLTRSADGGATWQRLGWTPYGGLAHGVFAGEGMVMLPQPDHVYASIRTEIYGGNPYLA